MDGDGYADIIMGDQDGADGFEGLTYVLRGGPERPAEIDLETSERVLEILGPSDEAYSGSVVGPAGDFDGDGLSDAYIASLDAVDPFFERPPLYHLIFGRTDLPRAMRLDRLRGAGVVIHGAESTCFARGPLQRTGDLDGDGIQDLALCESPVAPPPGATFKAGSVFVVYGLSREVAFVRGDANQDEAVDISDAIFVLYYLFLGGEAPSCEDAADTDDSGRLDLTDAISLLLFLFQGGPEPPPPHPEPGRDPTADDLGCVGR